MSEPTPLEMQAAMTKMHEFVANRLTEIGGCFVNPKITLIVRIEDGNDKNLVFSNDKPDLAIAAFKQVQEKEALKNGKKIP